ALSKLSANFSHAEHFLLHQTDFYFIYLFIFIYLFFCLQRRYRAVYDYTAADDDEVSFLDGDMIVDVQKIDDGWMYGRVERTGQQGMLPANYVDEF
uniref:SH3 domain-containing protein n=1 Tax=Poecilia reticulata TaxID=8081 RepID=A0A3P9NDD7_POERE